jgi:hypothetical protein
MQKPSFEHCVVSVHHCKVLPIDLEEDGTVYQIVVAPRRIDIITAAKGLKFEHTYQNAVLVNLDGIDVHIPSIGDLITNKRATGRTKDLADAEALELLKTSNNGIE